MRAGNRTIHGGSVVARLFQNVRHFLNEGRQASAFAAQQSRSTPKIAALMSPTMTAARIATATDARALAEKALLQPRRDDVDELVHQQSRQECRQQVKLQHQE